LEEDIKMAINQNHLFEDLDGVKCAVVEKNVSPQRVEFLKSLLEYNGFKVIVVGSPPPKASPAPAAVPGADPIILPAVPEPPAPTSFTIGVTDVTFNATNAIFGRLLKTKDGHVVTQAYWLQKENLSDDSVPYFSKKI
jgi:hypothetical protein